MARQVNFLNERQQNLTKTQSQDRSLMRRLAVIFAITVVFSVVSVGGQIFLQGRLDRVTEAQEQTRSAILSNEEIEKVFLITVQKVEVLTELFKERQNKQQAIAYFTTVFGDSVLVKQIEYDGTERLLSFRLEAKDVFVLERVFNILQSSVVKEKYSQVRPNDLRRVETGAYQMSVAVVLEEPKE